MVDGRGGFVTGRIVDRDGPVVVDALAAGLGLVVVAADEDLVGTSR
jgi:hypothetical protein